MAASNNALGVLERMAAGLERLDRKGDFLAVEDSQHVDNPDLNRVKPPQPAANPVEARHDARFRNAKLKQPFNGIPSDPNIDKALIQRYLKDIVSDVLGGG